MNGLACQRSCSGFASIPAPKKFLVTGTRVKARFMGSKQRAVRQETALGQQLAFMASQEELHHLFLPALHDHLQQLKAQQEALRSTSRDSEAAAKGDITALVAAQLREAQIKQIKLAAEELIYTWCLFKLARAGISLLQDVDVLGTEEALLSKATDVLAPLPLDRLLSPAVADAVIGLVASTFGDQQAGRPSASLLTCIDRVQAARLYAGNIEYGYFVRGMEARCLAQGLVLGDDSSHLVAFAGRLPKEELRAACTVRTLEAWRAAVRHTGHAFRLQAPAAAAAEEEGDRQSSSLPYPQLEVTSSGAHMAPLAHLSEYFSQPGAAAEEAAAAASRAARGWKRDGQAAPAESLPAPDLVMMRLDVLQHLLLQGAALGALLYDAEAMVQAEGDFTFTPRGVAKEGL